MPTSSLGSLENGVEPVPSQLWDLSAKAAPHDQPQKLGMMRGAWERLKGAVGRGKGGAGSRIHSSAAGEKGRATG